MLVKEFQNHIVTLRPPEDDKEEEESEEEKAAKAVTSEKESTCIPHVITCA
jgi:hypothetical protein